MIFAAIQLALFTFTAQPSAVRVGTTPTRVAVAPVAVLGRREALTTAGAATLATVLSASPSPAFAEGVKTVTVAGATGQTGRRVLSRLAAASGVSVVGGVRNVESAQKKLSESKIEIRGAMIEKGAAVRHVTGP